MSTPTTAPAVDPIVVEIVQGTLASVEMEVETAIARTSRSPMIRDAHDFRAGIHDRQLRKLTGRSYSALVHPVARGQLAQLRSLQRPDLADGDLVHGPAVIEEFGSTVPVHPGFQVRVDAWGNLVITKPGGGVAGAQQQEEQA